MADYFLIDAVFLGQNSVMASAHRVTAAPVLVPEPALSAVVIAMASLLARRRRTQATQ